MKLKKQFEYNLIIGNLKKSLNILDKIYEKFGLSYWYIENKLLVLQYVYGYEEQRDFYNEMISPIDRNFISNIIIEQVDKKIYKSFSYNQIKKFFEKEIKPAKDASKYKEIVEYIIFKINPFYSEEEFSWGEILAFESKSSIIDYYLTTLRILKFTVTKNNYSKINVSGIINVIKLLTNSIDDENLKSLYSISNFKHNYYKESYSNSKMILQLIDSYTIGDYKKCIKLCNVLLENEILSAEVLELYPKCIIKLNMELPKLFEGSFLDNYLKARISLELKDSSIEDSINILKKLSLSVSYTILGEYVHSYIQREYNNSKELKMSSFNLIGYLNYNYINPLLIEFINEDEHKKYINELYLSYPNSITIKMYKTIYENNIEELKKIQLPKDRYLKYYSKILINQGKYKDAIIILKKLEIVCSSIDLNEITKWLLECYLDLNMIEVSLEIIVLYSLKNNSLYYNFSFTRILNKIDLNIKEHLNLAIFYDLYIKNIEDVEEINNDLQEKLFDAYEDYLDSQNCNKPSELLKESLNEKSIYFLNNICSISLISKSTVFEDMAEVEDERINLCNFLIKNDLNNYDKYLTEISYLSEKRLLRKSLIEVENNKIAVDVVKIKNAVEKTMKDNYYRYISNCNKSVTNIEYVVEKITKDVYDREIIGHIPKDDNIRLIFSLILSLRDHFISNTNYGLDGNLSLEIRHGKIISQLRRPFEQYHLITAKDKNTQKYTINKYWLKKYSDFTEKDKIIISEKLNAFSEKIDSYFYRVKDIWIQISTESNENGGVFNFSFSIDTLEAMLQKINKNTEFDEFLDYVFEVLWRKTDNNLVAMRKKITVDLNDFINNECINLLKELNNVSPESKYKCSELKNSINSAKTASQYNLETIANWFNISDVMEGKPFFIGHALNVALEMLKSMHPNIQILCDENIDEEIILPRRTLKNYVNIFFILLENTISHRDVNQNEIYTKINVFLQNKNVIGISFINKSKCYNRSTIDCNNLTEINESLKKTVSTEIIKKEGGTGFLKIRKIITIDLNSTVEKIYLFYNIDSMFEADIRFITGDIVYEDIDRRR
ncbi:hypothetical protein AC231_04625 [Clostridium pasteurianum]|nr:hypothetical protein AC231_04625 [Clostridium pasteurianum]